MCGSRAALQRSACALAGDYRVMLGGRDVMSMFAQVMAGEDVEWKCKVGVEVIACSCV